MLVEGGRETRMSRCPIRAEVGLLRELVATPSPSGSEAAAAAVAVRFAETWGLHPVVADHSVSVVVAGRAPGPALAFLSHLDTVPPGEGWSRDPHGAEIVDGRLYGRGSSDAKGPVAAMLAAAADLAASGGPARGSLTVLLGFSEETRETTMERAVTATGPFAAAVVGEPTGLDFATAQRGLLVCELRARGVPHHAGHDGPESAITALARDLAALPGTLVGRSHPALGDPRITPTRIGSEGPANATPAEASARLDIRTTPAWANEELLAELRSRVNGELRVVSVRLAPCATPAGSRLLAAARKAAPGGAEYGSPTCSDWVFVRDIDALKCGRATAGCPRAERSSTWGSFLRRGRSTPRRRSFARSGALWGSGPTLFAFTTDDRWDAAPLGPAGAGGVEGWRRRAAFGARRGAAARCGLLREAAAGRFAAAEDDEDIHSAIERVLTARLGAAGARIHAGRSRNDQVAVAVRLWLKDALLGLHEAGSRLADSLLGFARRHRAALWPGYTHTRAAMPSSAGQWAHAHICGLLDTMEGLPALWARLDRCPLGSGAGFGVPLALDPAVAAKALGFAGAEPSLAAVQLGRGKLEADALWFAVQLGHDLGRLCADVVLYGGEEFDLLALPAGWTTGSSIMPQKRNPDLFELARARAGEVEGELATVLRLKANLTSGYHRDFQRLKAPLLRGLGTMRGALAAVAAALPELLPRPGAAARVSGGILAADAALALAERGVPFRTAYRRIAKELADRTFRAEIAPKRLFERRRVAGGLGNLGLDKAAARLRQTRRWATREARRFSAATVRLAGG